ncbi:MAG: ATP-dependent DNA helicase [Candidatus Saccharimonadales bacterium]
MDSKNRKDIEAYGKDRLSTLNAEQLRAVTHNRGPLLVVAGAGTGKTSVITERIAWLISKGHAKPEEILALTFTDKAAGEMLDRLDILIGWDAYKVNVMTFNAFGSQLLLRFGHHLGKTSRGEIIPDTAKVVLLSRHLKEAELSYYGGQDNIIEFLSAQLEYIQKLQNTDINIEDFEKYVKSLSNKSVHKLDLQEAEDRLKIYKLYEEVKTRYGVIDYYDQIKLPLQLLEERPNIAERLASQYKYVLVDEYQDTNPAQDKLLRAFVPSGGNIFAVGDDDQAIYGFRGASLSNILNFAEHFKVKEPLVLTQNYRSTQEILDTAYKLIQNNNPNRLEVKLNLNKKLKAQKNGASVHFVPCATSREEKQEVADKIATRLSAGENPESIAVLATSHAQLRQIAKVLHNRSVPYALSSSVDVFEQAELLQLWHLLRWLNLQADEEAIIQLLHGPFMGFSYKEVRKVRDFAVANLVSMEEAMERLAKNEKGFVQAVKQLYEWREWSKELNISQLVYKLVFATGLSDEWIERADREPRLVRVFENLQLWLQQCQAFEHAALNSKLSGYMELFLQPPEIITQELTGNEHGVVLLTVHAAKGLEFDTVFIINNTFEAWSGRGLPGTEEIPEELLHTNLDLPPEHEQRRLLYVALTRAKTNLYLSAPVQGAGGRAKKPAPFMKEIFSEKKLQKEIATNVRGKIEESLEKIQQFAPKTLQLNTKTMPFESTDGWLELDTTALESYKYCPYEFYLNRVLKIRSPLGPQVAFGQLLHQAFHLYYRSKLDEEPVTLEELSKYIDESWSDRGYKNQKEAESARKLAQQTLKEFYIREEKINREIVSTEEKFRLTFPEHKLVIKGRIDAVFKTKDGLEVRDFKTGRGGRDTDKLSDKAKENLQLRTYALAIKETEGQIPVQVVLDYVVTGKEGTANLSERIINNHKDKIVQIAEDIRSRKFEPNASPLHSCIAHRYWGKAED